MNKKAPYLILVLLIGSIGLNIFQYSALNSTLATSGVYIESNHVFSLLGSSRNLVGDYSDGENTSDKTKFLQQVDRDIDTVQLLRSTVYRGNQTFEGISLTLENLETELTVLRNALVDGKENEVVEAKLHVSQQMKLITDRTLLIKQSLSERRMSDEEIAIEWAKALVNDEGTVSDLLKESFAELEN